MIQEIKIINGNATFTFIETDKGKALNITFNGNIHLKSNGIKKWEKWKDEDYDYNILSLQDIRDRKDYYYHGHNNIPHWVWCTGIRNNEIIAINIEAYFGNIHDETKSNITGEISVNGWQIQYGSLEHVVE